MIVLNRYRIFEGRCFFIERLRVTAASACHRGDGSPVSQMRFNRSGIRSRGSGAGTDSGQLLQPVSDAWLDENGNEADVGADAIADPPAGLVVRRCDIDILQLPATPPMQNSQRKYDDDAYDAIEADQQTMAPVHCRGRAKM
jgi:hypothetical protein